MLTMMDFKRFGRWTGSLRLSFFEGVSRQKLDADLITGNTH
jgi:hypothetical protein